MFLTITKYTNRKTVVGNEVSLDLGDFANLFRNPIITEETTAEFKAMSKDEQADLKDKGGYIAGTCSGSRAKGCVTTRTAITLDLDEGDVLTADNIKSRCQYKYFLHSTRKHTKENPRYRLIVPLAEPVAPSDYELASRTLAQDLCILDSLDPSTYQPERMMYFPTISSDGLGNYVFIEGGDNLLNVNTFLSRYNDKTDMACWPRSNKEYTKVREMRKSRNTELYQDPLAKPGLIGAFNRAYPIKEAIATFLNDVYIPSPYHTDRYSYANADSVNGLVIYEDSNTAYSFHSTDPACGQALNAFDLVRIHLFGEEDYGIDPTTHISERLSQLAMLEFARKDPKVREEVLNVPEGMEPDYGLLEPKAAPATAQSNTDWQKDLTCTKGGKLENSLTNFAQILRNDPRLQGIMLNEMSGKIIVVKDLPWRKAGGDWSNADFSQLNVFIDGSYHIAHDKHVRDVLIAVAHERSIHPLKTYLEMLPDWDGTPRLDSLLIDYLRAEDNEYTRAVTRKTLVAAIARVFHPGIKFDTVLTLVGPQGVGKSTLLGKLANKYFTDTLSLNDMKDKTAAEKIAGYWIVEIPELAGVKTADMEMVKSFITRCDDAYRPAYGAVSDSHPRQCILVGTTNREDGFLYDTTGNRRFWPVKVTGQSTQHPWDLTAETINQIWSEAKYRYDQGEKLFLEGDLATQASERQHEMLSIDERVGIAEAWLDRIAYNHISGVELWVKCFEYPKASYDKKAQNAMVKILQNLDGWEYEGRTNRGRDFGRVRTYRRINEVSQFVLKDKDSDGHNLGTDQHTDQDFDLMCAAAMRDLDSGTVNL